MKFRTLGRATAAGMSLLVASAGLALADDVSNNLDSSVDATLESMSLTVGDADGTAGFVLHATNGDAKNGCNLTGAASSLVLAVSSSDTAKATVSPAQIEITACEATAVNVSVHAVAAGSATISVSFSSVTTASAATAASDYNLAPASFTVNVSSGVVVDPCDSVPNPAAPVFNPDPATDNDGNNGWFVTTPTVSATSSTVGATISYSTDSGATFTATAPTLSDGTTTVIAQATDDSCSNRTSQTSATFYVDTTAPTLNPSVSPDPVVLNGSATATANASDPTPGSGLLSSSCDAVDTSAVGSAQSVDCYAEDNAGNTNQATATYSVIYAVCGWDSSTAVKAGATIPLKLYLCDAAGNNVSSSGVVVKATSLKKLDNTAVGIVEDSGSANPDSNFRYDSTLFGSGGYIFNLSTKTPSPALGAGSTKLTTGTWQLSYSVDGVSYSLTFDVK